MIFAGIFALFLESAIQGFNILLSIGAGTGLLFLLRWFWWRINAFAEITAMIVSFLAALYFHFADLPGWSPYLKLIASVATTTVAWLLVAFIGPRTDVEVLSRFYKLIRPQGPGWKTVRARVGPLEDDHNRDNIPGALLNIFVGCLSVYALLFGVGYALYSNYLFASAMITIGVVGVVFLIRRVVAVSAN